MGQTILALVIIINLITLGYATLSSSDRAVKQAAVVTQAESISSSIIFTQREALVYTTKMALWVAGSLTRRDLQIARALLAQRMSVIDIGGKSMGARSTPDFLTALKDSDALVASSPIGFLPLSLQIEFADKSKPLINEIVDHARKLIVSYQRDLDTQFRQAAIDRANSARTNLMLLYLLVFLTSCFLIWAIFDFRRKYLFAKSTIIDEQITLSEAREDLADSQTKVLMLQDLNIAKNDFISTVNHELRTPLTSIIGYVELLHDIDPETSPQDFHKIVSVIESNSESLLDLVESILSLTKLDADQDIDQHEVQNLFPILDNALKMLSLQASARSINIDLQVHVQDSFQVIGSRTQISQVFVNLVSNAIKFSKEGSSIEIGLNRKVDPDLNVSVEITVRDFGMGIPKEDLNKLFTKFFRAKNAAANQIPGSGLGLAIVKKTMDLHGGFVTVASVEGVGSLFTLTFPGIKSEVEVMVEARRSEVLAKAIIQLETADNENLSAVAHSMGGAIAFYTFEAAGAELEEFSQALQIPGKLTDSAKEAKKLHILNYLKLRQTELDMKKIGAI
jgi:signal transduction histidine kinase